MQPKQQPNDEEVALHVAHLIGITPHSTNYSLNLSTLFSKHTNLKPGHWRLIQQHHHARHPLLNPKPNHHSHKHPTDHGNEHTTHPMGLSMLAKRNTRTSQGARAPMQKNEKQWARKTGRSSRQERRFESRSCLTQRNNKSKVAQSKGLLLQLWQTWHNPISPELAGKGGSCKNKDKGQCKQRSREGRIKYNSAVKSFEFY